jgi:hypothetical protein
MHTLENAYQKQKNKTRLNWKVSSIAGALIWGTWTLYINLDGGTVRAFFSAISQFFLSAASIGLLSLGIDKSYNFLQAKNLTVTILAAILPWGAMLFLVISIHLYINTYDVFYTLLPTSSAGFIYSITYSVMKHRLSSYPQIDEMK